MQKRRFRSVLRVLMLVAMVVPMNASVAGAAQWRNVYAYGFEGLFPSGKWVVYDGSHTSTQGIWSKTLGGFNSQYALHPRGGLTPYNYNTHTWMRYGPFSLVGATDARMTFQSRMETEPGYDFFSFAYSCTGVEEWTGRQLSGDGPGPFVWVSRTLSLKPCIGKSAVYVQFKFTSDQSLNLQGVWLDAVRIQKFS